ncbi:MAG: hypothetical protein V1860_02500 [bacterium]
MFWINLLHLYQPPTMEREMIEEVARTSYGFIIETLEKNPHFKITINICGGLAEQLDKFGYGNILSRLKILAEKGQVELTGSAAFHGFLPLLPESEIIYQIKTNDAINGKYFGNCYKPSGFFIPEMAYSKKLGKIIADLGYKWIILDDIHLGGKLGNVNYNKGYVIKENGLQVLFRKRQISKTYVPSTLLKFAKENQNPHVVITATDGELYGHHHKDINGDLNKLLSDPGVHTLAVSDFLKKNKTWMGISPVCASWESTEKELKNNEPYILWNNARNKIQQKIWELANLALKTANKHRHDSQYGWARDHLNKGLASCTFWWAAARDFRESFGPISWNPDEIEKGIDELIKTVRALDKISRLTKIKAEKLYISIKKMIWEKHWKYYWKK